MAIPTKQATDKNVFQWRDSPFVSGGPAMESESVGETNSGTEDNQTMRKPSFVTKDKGD